jgi:hypothetical protein
VVTPTAPATRRRWRPGVLAWALWALAMLGIATIFWFDHLLRQAGRPELALSTEPAFAARLLAGVSAATVGAVLASRRPRHPVGWLLLTLGVSVLAYHVVDGYARYGLLAQPGALPLARYAPVLFAVIFLLEPLCIGLILVLTPTGSLPSPGWRWWTRGWVVTNLVWALAWVFGSQPLDPPLQEFHSPLAVPALAGLLLAVQMVTSLVFTVGLLVATGSLVVRFRRARGVERQQVRWVAFAAALIPLVTLVAIVANMTAHPTVARWTIGLYVTLLPLAIGAAILRYRLYDLDRIISRTLAYGVLTLLLGGGYTGVVLGLGQLLPQDSSLVVAAATLAVAAAVQPARRRIQELVDRRFNRRRYDAAQTIQAFSARLRQQTDLDTLTGELLAVVDQTMQPTQAWLWLRPSHPASDAATAAVILKARPTAG